MTDSVQQSLNKLIEQTRNKREPLPPAGPVAPIPESVGFSAPQPPASNPGAGGMAWPLTETAFEDREVYAEETLYTSDGIFSWTRQRYKSLKMKDASGSIGKILLKEPVA